jgi:hypothetical protein
MVKTPEGFLAKKTQMKEGNRRAMKKLMMASAMTFIFIAI